jgi:hypothetical protein
MRSRSGARWSINTSLSPRTTEATALGRRCLERLYPHLDAELLGGPEQLAKEMLVAHCERLFANAPNLQEPDPPGALALLTDFQNRDHIRPRDEYFEPFVLSALTIPATMGAFTTTPA